MTDYYRADDLPPMQDYGDDLPPDETPDIAAESTKKRLIDGAAFILDATLDCPSLWGDGEQVLWPEGEAFYITGSPGVGKTTIAQQLVLTAIGIGPTRFLGLPVARQAKILYLAMDRPRQIAKSFGRMVSETDRATLAKRLVIWKGPQNTSAFSNSGVTVTGEGVSTVSGALVLKPGSITDADLSNPAGSRGAVYLTTTAFAPTSTWAEVAGVDLIVPDGATRLLLTATAWVYAVNNTASADDLNARVSLGLVDGQAFLTPLAVAGYNTISAGLATLAEDLIPASTVRLFASAKTTTGTFTTDPANTATLTASLTWLR